MRSELAGQEKNRIEIKVEFEASEFEAELKKVYDNISRRANIPGFRKGHVPRRTIEMRFGRNAIHDEAIENLLNENISEIMKDYGIEPLFAPRLKSKGPVTEGQPVSVNLLIEARPEIKLPEFEDIEVERLISVVDDTMVNDMIERLRSSQAKVEAAEHDAIIQDDSLVTVEFSIVDIDAEGEEISRSKKPEMATVNMQDLPSVEFREPLIGKKVGDSADVTIKGQKPDSTYEAETEGDTADVTMTQANDDSSDSTHISKRYEMKIVEIGKKILPELTPEFFKQSLGYDCDTEENFRDATAQRILERLQDSAEADAEARALNTAAEMSGLEVPGSLVFQEMERIKAFDEKDAKGRYNLEFKELLRLRGIEYEDYEKQIMGQAWLTVRNTLVIEEIVRKFEIEVEPSELDEWIKENAGKNGLDAELMKKAYFKDKDSVNMLVDRVLTDKAIKFLMDNVKIRDVSELTQRVAKEESAETEETEKTEEAEE